VSRESNNNTFIGSPSRRTPGNCGAAGDLLDGVGDPVFRATADVIGEHRGEIRRNAVCSVKR
jgi:hypothetical protein